MIGWLAVAAAGMVRGPWIAIARAPWNWHAALVAGVGASIGLAGCTATSAWCHSRERPADLYDYVVVGNGVAGKAAVATLTAMDPSSSLLVVASEDRPRWGSVASRGLSSHALFTRDSICQIDVENKTLLGESGRVYRYRRCLLAMGTEASRHPDNAMFDKRAAGFVGNAKLLGGRARLTSLLNAFQASGDGAPAAAATTKATAAAATTTTAAETAITAVEAEATSAKAAVDASAETSAFAAASPTSQPHVTVVGGDWNALAVVNTLLQAQAQVTLVCSEPAPLATQLPRYLCDSILALLREQHVDSAPYSILRYVIAREGDAEAVLTRTFNANEAVSLRTDYIVLAETRGRAVAERIASGWALECDEGGLAANCELSVASDVYAAGDGVSIPVPDAVRGREPDKEHGYGGEKDWGRMRRRRRRRSEGVHQAAATGAHAARNMCGGRAPFQGVAVRELRALGVELAAVGEVCSSLDTVGLWATEAKTGRRAVGGRNGRGAVFYCDSEGEVVGVLLWNGAPGATAGAAEKLSGEGIAAARLSDVASELLGEGKSLTRRVVGGRAQALPQEETLWEPLSSPNGGRSHSHRSRRGAHGRPPESW